MSLRVVFMGTPDFAVPTLSEIVGQGHEVVAAYTRAPKPRGRGLVLQETPVASLAHRLGIPVETPATLRNEEALARLSRYEPDVAVVVAYGLILPPAILAVPRLACLNLHASLLPRWRGAAPIQRAIMAGDTKTGVMVMRMEEGLDTGPVGLAERVPIPPEANAREMHDRLMRLGADLMARALGALERDALTFRPQAVDGVTYAAKITKEEARIDWSKPAKAVCDHIRGLAPTPGAFFEVADERVRVLKAAPVDAPAGAAPGTVLDAAPTIACGAGALRLVELQRAGREAMHAEAFQRGAGLQPGQRLG